MARREAYEWMETSIPESSTYILIFVKKGDAKGVYEALWRRFAALTVKELQQQFWSVEMKDGQQVDYFAHVVSKAAINLSHAGITVPDQQIATAFVQGLNKNYMMIIEKYRNLKTFTFVDVVEDATNFAIDNKLLNVNPVHVPTKVRPLSGSVLIMCRFWRMKKGCYKKDKCPMVKYHTPETKGQGWKNESAYEAMPESENYVHTAVPNDTYKCHTCNKRGHRENCPASESAVSNLSLNFMMISDLSATCIRRFR